MRLGSWLSRSRLAFVSLKIERLRNLFGMLSWESFKKKNTGNESKQSIMYSLFCKTFATFSSNMNFFRKERNYHLGNVYGKSRIS